MPILFLVIGLALAISAYRGKQGELGTLVYGDFTGPGSFVLWLFAILCIGALGYVPSMKPLSNGFLVFLGILFVIAHRSFISEVSAAFGNS